MIMWSSDTKRQRKRSRDRSGANARCLLLVALALFATPSVPAQTAEDKTVVPGSRIGPWKLDTSLQELTQMNGSPSGRPSIASRYVSRTTWYSWSELGIAAASHDNHKVEFLAAFKEPQFSTRSGIRIQSSRRRIEAAYGEPEIESDVSVGGKIITALIYDKRGLAVFLDRDVAQMILVFRPGDGGALSSLCGG